MENGPFADVLPIKKWWFSIAIDVLPMKMVILHSYISLPEGSPFCQKLSAESSVCPEML